jgi:hypothetical protein
MLSIFLFFLLLSQFFYKRMFFLFICTVHAATFYRFLLMTIIHLFYWRFSFFSFFERGVGVVANGYPVYSWIFLYLLTKAYIISPFPLLANTNPLPLPLFYARYALLCFFAC